MPPNSRSNARGRSVRECQQRRHTPYRYIWFTVIALQRIQGVSVKKQHAARAALVLAKRGARAHQVEQLAFDDDATPADLAAVIGELARTKAMR